MGLAFVLVLLPVAFYASVVQVEGTNSSLKRHSSCCFGSVDVAHGQVAMTLPRCCKQLVCNNGQMEHRHIGELGASQCCELDGVLYPSGYELSVCWPLVCQDGNWTFLGRIQDCCKQCVVYNYNHFVTFDEYRYDWRGECNYSLAQSDFTQEPRVGVFSDSKRCFGCGSCLGSTTFRNDPHTVIAIDSGSVFNLVVNGATYTVPETGVAQVTARTGPRPVIAWRLENCVVLVGSSRIALHLCRNRLDVWAHPSHIEGLDGLCGHFNMYVGDDLTDRTNTVHQLQFWPREFASSWKTDIQTSVNCLSGPTTDTACQELQGSSCLATDPQMEAYRRTCKERLLASIGDFPELMHYIDSCSVDLCVMYASGANERVIDDWLQNLVDIVRVAGRLLHLAGKGSGAGKRSDLQPYAPVPGKNTEIMVNVTVPEASSEVTVFTTGYTVLRDTTTVVTSLAEGYDTVLTYYDDVDYPVTSTVAAVTPTIPPSAATIVLFGN